ncbi:MAG: LacI family DNA-binding transcriptional regulator [Mogibacterium sp.]|nr:LacI family DNA-binding transcriptional regulator [Mogibacterium sp.]
MTTIKDIARESGYSTGTVSRALNGSGGVSEKAIKRIMEVVDRYDFRLNENAKFLKQRSLKGIAVLIKGTYNMLFASLTELIQKRIEEAGYECSIYYLSEDDHEVTVAHRIALERKPEAILFLGCNLQYFKEGFSGIDIPCLMVTNDGSDLGYDNLSSVSTDDRMAAEYIIDYLVSRGHTRIGIVGGDPATSAASDFRYQGCRRAFEKHGLSFDPSVQFEKGYFTLDEGYNGAARLFRKMPDVTAIFAMSDITAIGVIRAASDRGLRVPDDLSVIGFDGVDIADYLVPRLTTIRQNREVIVSKSLEILREMIRHDATSVHAMVPFTLISGNSVRQL